MPAQRAQRREIIDERGDVHVVSHSYPRPAATQMQQQPERTHDLVQLQQQRHGAGANN